MTLKDSIFLFDVDGTLTPPRQKITEEFEEFFCSFFNKNQAYLASGSDFGKIKDQLTPRSLNACDGVFTCSGNELWIDDEIKYRNDFKMSDRMYMLLLVFLEYTKCPTKTGNHIEERTGMVNFSTVGRNATLEQRKEYHAWDTQNRERELIAETIREHHGEELTVSIGGEISIDIYPKGQDKSQAVNYIKANHPGKRIIFFGDKTHEGGNDYSAVQALGDEDMFYSVKSWEETYDILKTLEVQQNE